MASGRPATWVLLAIAGLLAIAAVAPPTTAYHQGTVRPGGAAVSATVTLPVNNWTAYTFEMTAGDTLTYEVRVLAGTPIDLYIVPDVGLADYANDTSVQFLEYAEETNQRNISGSFGSVAGVIGVILDNTDVGQGGADPAGPVTVSVSLVKSSNLYLGGLILLACGVVLLVVAVVVAFVLQRRKAAAPAPPPGPYGAPPVPYQAPPGPSPPEGVAGPSDGPSPPPPQNP
jgi:hypothetical protein